MGAAYRVSLDQLRRYMTMVHFESASSEGTGADQVCAHVRARGAIQFDPIDVVGRNADLVLQSRIDAYRPDMLREAIYEKHRLYDGYDKNLCIYPIEDYPYLSRMRRETAAWFRENPVIRAAMPRALEEIEKRGPLCSEDLDMNEKVRWPWGNTRMARAALESLWMEGRIAVAGREGVRKYYDLFGRCYDPAIAAAEDPHPDDGEYYCWQVLRRLRSVGLLSGGASDAFLCVEGLKARQRAEAFAALEKRGKIIPVTDGTFTGYIAAEGEALLRSAECRAPEERMRFIAPLDNLMWDRKLVQRLFGFEYRWEIYVPAQKRKYGYYVLPVMLGSRFAARFEAEKFDGKTLRIKNWWWEEGWTPESLPAGALGECLHGFAAFLGAEKIDCGNAEALPANFG